MNATMSFEIFLKNKDSIPFDIWTKVQSFFYFIFILWIWAFSNF